MIKKAKGLSLVLVLTIVLWGIFILPCSPQSTDKLTIVTYYPSPYGVYNELRSKRMAIGDNYYKNSDYCWGGGCTNTIDPDADLAVEGKVGIGTTTPGTNKLYVAGNTKINGDLSVTGKIRGSLCPTPYIVRNSGSGTNCATACANAGHSCAFGQYYSSLGKFYNIINCSREVFNPATAFCACCND